MCTFLLDCEVHANKCHSIEYHVDYIEHLNQTMSNRNDENTRKNTHQLTNRRVGSNIKTSTFIPQTDIWSEERKKTHRQLIENETSKKKTTISTTKSITH